MNIKRLIVFLFFAFLPMIAVGLVMHFGVAALGGQSDDVIDSAPTAALRGLVFCAGAMLIPLLAVIFTQLIFKEPVLKGLGISFKLNRWWWICAFISMTVSCPEIISLSRLYEIQGPR